MDLELEVTGNLGVPDNIPHQPPPLVARVLLDFELHMKGTQKSHLRTNRAGARGGHMTQVDPSSSATAEFHAVRFYENDRSLARIVAEFLNEGFDHGNPGIVVATEGQRAEIIRELTDASCDVPKLQRSRDLVFLDAGETLSTFMMDGRPDAQEFSVQMHQVIDRVRRGRTNCTVRIFGQMVDVLWQRGEREAAIRLEVLWNRLARTEAFALLCGYAIGNFYKHAAIEDVSRQHSHVVTADGEVNRALIACHTNRRRSKRRGRR